jgi:hypothetical protein
MAQDCEKTFADKTMGINYYFYGDNTLVSEIWKGAQSKETLPNYQDMLRAQ